MWICIRSFLLAVFLTGAAAVLTTVYAQTPRQMEVLARVGPWPVISRMIVYRGRVWFANSVKGSNHNSADLWSLDPKAGDLRYERHLFSQDAGRPLVYKGLLYWPYEDTRASLGWGGIDVTNGKDWRYLPLPSATMFHVHGVVDWRGDLLALTSAWRAGLQLSRDGGATWSELYDHDTEPGRVSRMSRLVVAGGQAVGHLRGAGGFIRLVRWDGGEPRSILNWKQGSRFHGLTAHAGAAYLVRRDGSGSEIWVVEGKTARALPPATKGWRVRDLASDGKRLWALAQTHDGGEVWSSREGAEWRLEARLDGGAPISLAASGGGVYVGGTGEDGRGMLWGLVPQAMLDAGPVVVPPQPNRTPDGVDVAALATQLDAVLGKPESYLDHGRGKLRGLVYRIATANPPAELLSSRLAASLPSGQVPLMGGSKTVAAERLGQWILLWGMGLAGKGTVPLRFLKQPWDLPQHRSEKYFHPLLMALWTLTLTGQNDDDTIAALIARLDRDGDPEWLTGDVVGTLTALTDERFGYDIAAWRAWWDNRAGDE